MTRTLATPSMTSTLVAATSATRGAAPTGAKNAFSFPVSCNDGTTVQGLQFVVNNANGQGQGTNNNPRGQAVFAPAHVVGTHLVYHSQVFNLAFTFMPPSGPSFSFTNTASVNNPKTPINCTVDYTTPPDPQGNRFSLKGTVSGFSS